MAEHPLKVFETLDPELLAQSNKTRDLAFSDGVLPRKTKFLIAMALDAAAGAAGGVTSLADQAMKAGASKEEVAETLRVVLFINGAGGIYTAGRGVGDLLK